MLWSGSERSYDVMHDARLDQSEFLCSHWRTPALTRFTWRNPRVLLPIILDDRYFDSRSPINLSARWLGVAQRTSLHSTDQMKTINQVKIRLRI